MPPKQRSNNNKGKGKNRPNKAKAKGGGELNHDGQVLNDQPGPSTHDLDHSSATKDGGSTHLVANERPIEPTLVGLPAELLIDIFDRVARPDQPNVAPSYGQVLAVGRTCTALFRLALAAIARNVSLTNCVQELHFHTPRTKNARPHSTNSLSADHLTVRMTGLYTSLSTVVGNDKLQLLPLPVTQVHSLDLFHRPRSSHREAPSIGGRGAQEPEESLYIPAVRSLLLHTTHLRSLTLSNYGSTATLHDIVSIVAPRLTSLTLDLDCGTHLSALAKLALPNLLRVEFNESIMCRVRSHAWNVGACVVDSRLPAMPKVMSVDITVSAMREVPLVQLLSGKDFPHLSKLRVACTNDELGGGGDDFGLGGGFGGMEDDHDEDDGFGFGDPYFGGGIGGFGGGFGVGMGGLGGGMGGGPRVRTSPQMSALPTSFPASLVKVDISAIWADKLFRRVQAGPNLTHVAGGPLESMLTTGFRKVTHATAIEFDTPSALPMSLATMPALYNLVSLDLNLIAPTCALFQPAAVPRTNDKRNYRLLPNLETLLAGTPTAAAFLHVFETPKLRKLTVTANSDAFRNARLARPLLQRLDTLRAGANHKADHRAAVFCLTLPPTLDSLTTVIVEDHSVVELAGDDVLAHLTKLDTFQVRGRALHYLAKCTGLQLLTLRMSTHDDGSHDEDQEVAPGTSIRFEYGRIVRDPPPNGQSAPPPAQVVVHFPPNGLPNLRELHLFGPSTPTRSICNSVLVVPPPTLTALSKCRRLAQVTPRGHVWVGPAWASGSGNGGSWMLTLSPPRVDRIEDAVNFKMAWRGLARVPWTVRPSGVRMQLPAEVNTRTAIGQALMAKWMETAAEVQVWAAGFNTARGSKCRALPQGKGLGNRLLSVFEDGTASGATVETWGEPSTADPIPKLSIEYV